MKNLGIYVERWRPGIKNPEQADEFLHFVRRGGFEDVMLYVNEDIATPFDKTWNPIPFLLEHGDGIRFHAWMSLTIGGRDKSQGVNTYYYNKISECMEKYAEEKQISMADMGTIHRCEQRHDTKLFRFDPEAKASWKFILTRIDWLRDTYPKLYGFHLDEFSQGSDALVQRIREITPGKYLSCTVRLDQDHWKNWDIDEAIPMRIYYSRDRLKSIDLTNFKRITLGIYGANLNTTKDELAYLKSIDVTPIIYSYNLFSFNKKETREDLLGILQNG